MTRYVDHFRPAAMVADFLHKPHAGGRSATSASPAGMSSPPRGAASAEGTGQRGRTEVRASRAPDATEPLPNGPQQMT